MNNEKSVKIPIRPAEIVDEVLRVRRKYPNIFELRIWSLTDKTDFGWGPENVTRLALLCKN